MQAPTAPGEHDGDEDWISALTSRSAEAAPFPPTYFLPAPTSLSTTAVLRSYTVGTGASLFRTVLCPLIESAESSVIFVTCFWAPSASLSFLSASLRALSDKAQRRRDGRRIKVSIGLSSLSWRQKLTQTSAPRGRAYTPAECAALLGLPRATDVPGLEVGARSVFALPFSVLHPKFVIVDGARAALPSCNVSWEAWFEGAAVLEGPVVAQLLRFWSVVWDPDGDGGPAPPGPSDRKLQDGRAAASGTEEELEDAVDAVVLPSPHRRWLLPIPFLDAPAPPTPLNEFLLARFRAARRSVFLQTPNLTAAPVLAALADALRRGVDVRVVTSRRLMRLEQLATAGTTTACAVRGLAGRHAAMLRGEAGGGRRSRVGDEEAGPPPPVGRLRVEYFRARPDGEGEDGDGPLQTHVKISAFDDQVVVLGSGNMDRASWYTSQELGLALRDARAVGHVLSVLEEGMRGRTEVFYDSHSSDE
jgi:phosphatidylserine/phosphatidylglycerophosphate/cardiolipin synthase-like enzyme